MSFLLDIKQKRGSGRKVQKKKKKNEEQYNVPLLMCSIAPICANSLFYFRTTAYAVWNLGHQSGL